MLELRIKSDSLITSYNSNNGGSTSGGTITNNVDSLSKAAFTTPPTGLLTSASQLSSNAKATNEGSYEALLDGKQTTFFHTTWRSGNGDAPDEDHYLQIDLQVEVERIALKYGARGSTSGYVNPKDITIYATNNVNGSWEQITTATLTYDSNGKGLLSIDLGGKYRYIRISVQNSTLGSYSNGHDINGHAYWCLGELRIYNLGTDSQEGTGTDPQGNDEKPQVPKEVVENLQNCINAANSEIYSNVATQSTYDALLSAYNTFLGYLNESTDIERVQITPSVDVWFDLQGRRIAKPQTSGIYIHNGKKVWVK
ncbi:discoidin domain-containing protein [Pseudoprevotella muciniphila]|nr:discoidin domain-containing protein [Pseudoprevotella muciniphila]